MIKDMFSIYQNSNKQTRYDHKTLKSFVLIMSGVAKHFISLTIQFFDIPIQAGPPHGLSMKKYMIFLKFI